MTKMARGKSPRERERRHEAERDELRGDNGDRDTDRVARVRVAPDAAIKPERDEHEVAREEQDRKSRDETDCCDGCAVRPEPQDVGAVKRGGDDDPVDDDLDEAPSVDDQAAQEDLATLVLCVAAVDVREEARELHDQRERQERRR